MKLFAQLIVLFFLFNSCPSAETKPCYLYVTDSADFKYETVFEVGSALLNKYVAKVQEVPRSGLGKNDCTYNLTVMSDESTVSISVNGPKINSIGESTEKGLIGLQKAILVSIFRSGEDIQPEICTAYQTLLPEECEALEDMGPGYEGIWYVQYEDDDIQIVVVVDEDNNALVCETEGKKVNEVFVGRIEEDFFYLAEDEGFYVRMTSDDKLMVMHDEPEEYERIEEIPEICMERFEKEDLIE